MTRLKEVLKSDVFFFLFCFILFLVMEQHVIPVEHTDDAVFARQFSDMGAFQWASSFYLKWSGRIILTFLNALFLNLPLVVWKIMNALVFANMVVFLAKITESKWLRYGLLALILSIPQVTLSSATLWMTGSLNYLWPVSFMTVILYYCKCIFFQEERSRKLIIFAIVSTFFACNMEQTAAVSLVMLMVSILKKFIHRQIIPKDSIILLVFVLVNCGILFLAPGNYVRSLYETVQWNPSFDMLSVFDKLFAGTFTAIQYMFSDLRRIMFLFSIVIVVVRPFSILSLIPFLCFICSRDPYSYFSQNVFLVQTYLPLYQKEQFMWFPFFVCLTLFFLMVSEALKKCSSSEAKVWQFLIFCAAFTSVVVLGFSPTLEGSGERIYFLMSILMICAIIKMLAHSKYEKLLTVVLCAFMFPSFYSNMVAFLSDYGFLFLF